MIHLVGGLFFGVVAGVCAAPVWVMLSLPMRLTDTLGGGSMALCATALMLGAAVPGIVPLYIPLGVPLAVLGLLCGGIFVGMLASALTEALEVIPVLYEQLQIASDMRWAALALLLGKGVGAFAASWFG